MKMNLPGSLVRPNLFAISAHVAPRVAQLANTPSLLALALLMDGILAFVPATFHFHKENL